MLKGIGVNFENDIPKIKTKAVDGTVKLFHEEYAIDISNNDLLKLLNAEDKHLKRSLKAYQEMIDLGFIDRLKVLLNEYVSTNLKEKGFIETNDGGCVSNSDPLSIAKLYCIHLFYLYFNHEFLCKIPIPPPNLDTKSREKFETIEELHNYAVKMGVIESSEIEGARQNNLSGFNQEFNSWLQQHKGWENGTTKDYLKYLTRETFVEFHAFQKAERKKNENEFSKEKKLWEPQEVIAMDRKEKVKNVKYSHKEIMIAFYLMGRMDELEKDPETILKKYSSNNSVPKLMQHRLYGKSDVDNLSRLKGDPTANTKHLNSLRKIKLFVSGKKSKKAIDAISNIIAAFEANLKAAN